MELHLYLVSYDVSCPRRGRRVHRALRRCGAWQQFSAFVCRLTTAGCTDLERQLLRLMDLGNDRLMIVDLGGVASAEARLHRHGAIQPLPTPRLRLF